MVAKIINEAKKAGIFEADAKPLHRSELWNTGKEVFASVRVVAELPLSNDARGFQLEYCDPNLLLSKLVAESQWLQLVWFRATR